MDKLTDVGFWQHVAQALGPLGWAFIFAVLVCLFGPLSIEYGLSSEWRKDPRLPWISFGGALILGLIVSLLVAWPAVRYGIAIGIVAGAISHGVRMLLSQLRWFAWMRAKPKVDFVTDAQGHITGAHVEGYDGTVLPDRTQPRPAAGSDTH